MSTHDYAVTTGRESLAGAGVLFAIFGPLVLGPALSSAYLSNSNKKEIQRALDSVSDTSKRAMLLASGEDRILDIKEKRIFMDDIGLGNVAIQDTMDLLLRPRVERVGGMFDSSHVGYVGIVGGYNLENNGKFLEGSTAKSGTLLGTISEGDLNRYINSRTSSTEGF